MIKFEKIKTLDHKIEPILYHLTVEKNRNFFGNGICLHNCDYRGEIGIILINHSHLYDFEVNKGERIAQLVLNKVEQIVWEEASELSNTDRGDGGFGSTGKTE